MRTAEEKRIADLLRRKETQTVVRQRVGKNRVGILGKKRGREQKGSFTPAELLFEMQLQSRGFIEIDIAMRTTDPFRYGRPIIGEPTTIRGLEPGEIMKLRRDLQGWLIHWRAQLAIEREDAAVLERMKIGEDTE